MRAIGTLHPTDQVPVPADTVATFLMTGGSSAQAMDWPSPKPNIVRITPATTAGGAFFTNVNLGSTAAAVPSSALSTGTFVNHPVMSASVFQVPNASTGFSVACYSSGLVMVEMWRL